VTNLRYEAIPIRENRDAMVEASQFGFIAEPKYFQSGHAQVKELFMREGLAKLLREIEQQTLKTHQLRFKIWDPWRPRSVQRALYNEFTQRLRSEHPEWDEARLKKEVGVYVTPADDARIPPHATGGTVDLTLCDANGRDVEMGTLFDHFGPEAHLAYYEGAGRDVRIRDNRRLLSRALIDAGLNADNDEWWHYDYGNQKWALGVKRTEAFYGEVADCALKDGNVSCRFLQA
jgi:D-alanyl-D-alanine dipeptidase